MSCGLFLKSSVIVHDMVGLINGRGRMRSETTRVIYVSRSASKMTSQFGFALTRPRCHKCKCHLYKKGNVRSFNYLYPISHVKESHTNQDLDPGDF